MPHTRTVVPTKMVYSSIRLVANIAGVGIELFGFIEVYVTCCIQLYWHVLILAVRHFRHSELNMESTRSEAFEGTSSSIYVVAPSGESTCGEVT
jgi:hypothetical protein